MTTSVDLVLASKDFKHETMFASFLLVDMHCEISRGYMLISLSSDELLIRSLFGCCKLIVAVLIKSSIYYASGQ